MRFPFPVPLSEFFEQEINLPAQVFIGGVGSPEQYASCDLVFIFNARQLEKITAPPAFLIIEESLKQKDAINSNHLYVQHPRLVFQKFITFINKKFFEKAFSPGVHPTAIVDPSAFIDPQVSVGPYCVVGPNCELKNGVQLGAHVVLGAGVLLGENVCLDHHVTCYDGVCIGKNTRVCGHSTLGAPGFGFERDHQGWHHIPHLTSLQIGANCFIGSQVSIACGVITPTIIEDQVIIDNQVQIAHHVHIGRGSAIAGCVGIAGSTRIGKNCMIGGAVGIAGHLEIADQISVTGMSMVTKSLLEPGTIYSSGWAAVSNQEWRRRVASLSHLPRLLKDFKKIQQAISPEGE